MKRLLQQRDRGFTLVELLIVIVVIAILAAISIVAYNGIQQRAKNTAITDAASASLRLVQAYVATNDKYPLGPTTTVGCITTDSGCNDSAQDRSGISSFESNMSTVGHLPKSVPTVGTDRYGVMITYWSGASAGPVYLTYFLLGKNQQCGLNGVLNVGISGPATNGYTNGNSGGKTQCIVKVPGPSS